MPSTPEEEGPQDRRWRQALITGIKRLGGPLEAIRNVDFDNPAEPPHGNGDRRDLLRATAGEVLSSPTLTYFETYWQTMNDVVNYFIDKPFPRMGFLVGLGVLGGALTKFLGENPDFFNDAKLYAKFLPVWNELQELKKPITNEQLEGMLHNPYGKNRKIRLSVEEAKSLFFVLDGDSMYLDGGDRKNSLGPAQPDCWAQFLTEKLNEGIAMLGVKSNVEYANYAQPGAPISALIGPQLVADDDAGKPIYINVQLGATTIDQMRGDNYLHPSKPPRAAMSDHEGALGAIFGVHGNDLDALANLIIALLDPELDTYNQEFAAFVKNPTKDKLENSDPLVDIVFNLLKLYKEAKSLVDEDIPKVLDVYRTTYGERQDKGKMFLIVTQPFRYDEAQNAPVSKPGTARGTRSAINIKKYGAGGKMAGQMATLPFYSLEAPHLQKFEEETGIQVVSLPMLHMSGIEEFVDWTGHVIKPGHIFLSGEAADLFEIYDETTGKEVHFENGAPVIYDMAA